MDIWERMHAEGLNPGKLPEQYNGELLQDFLNFWVEYNERGGFFSHSDVDRILSRHLYESLVCLEAIWDLYAEMGGPSVSRETAIADVGSGPGLPGLLMCADKHRKVQICLLDSSRRRLSLVEDVFGNRFKALNFEFNRVEELQGQFDIAISRAFIPYPICAEVVSGILKKNSFYMMLAGQLPELDAEQEKLYLKRLGFVSRETRHIPELEFLGQRHIIGLRHIDKPFHGYPRSWKKIKGSLSKWKRS